MDTSHAIGLVRESLILILTIGAPVLLVGLAVALVVSVLQALTQVQEQTLSFMPKIVAMLLALAAFGPWMLARLLEFSQRMFGGTLQ